MTELEFKVKTNANKTTDWESLPVVRTIAPADLDATIRELMKPDVYEIRWNRAGYTQGTYIPHPDRLPF